MKKEFENKTGQILSSLDWLTTHHEAKQAARIRTARSLPIFPGMKVIDLGCGPGFWTELLAEQVAPHGRVLGIDHDYSLIQFARENISDRTNNLCDFDVASFENLEEYSGGFDIAFCCNCLAYFDNVSEVITSFRKVVKPGGDMIIRHFDNAYWWANGVPASLTMTIHLWVERALSNRKNIFNNSLGHCIYEKIKEAGVKDVRVTSESIDISGNLSVSEKSYIRETAMWSANIAKEVGDIETVNNWLEYFEHGSSKYILDKDDCLFTFIEYTVIGKVE